MPYWNVAAAQYGAVAGDYRANLAHHLEFIRCAAAEHIDLLLFPELSLSGHWPAHGFPDFTDTLFDPLHDAANAYNMTVFVGMTLGDEAHISSAMVGFFPEGSRIACCKPATSRTPPGNDVSHPVIPLLGQRSRNIALALNSVSHDEAWPRGAAEMGADLYATGALMTALSYAQDAQHMQRWAQKYGLTILQANHARSASVPHSVGRSACWDSQGQCVVQASHGEQLAVGRRDEKGWQGEIIPLR